MILNNMLDIVKNNILENELVKSGDKVVVAVSGGPGTGRRHGSAAQCGETHCRQSI